MRTTHPSLIERLRKGGDEESWSRFVALYGPLVRRLGCRCGLDPQRCESLVQDFFVRALEALPSFRYQPERGRFRGWVREVALNELRRAERARASYEHAVATYRALEGDDEAPDELEAEWALEENRRLVELALERLRERVEPEKFAIFTLHVLEERTPAEVAAFFGCRPNYVSLTKFRLLENLSDIKRELAEEWDERG